MANVSNESSHHFLPFVPLESKVKKRPFSPKVNISLFTLTKIEFDERMRQGTAPCAMTFGKLQTLFWDAH